MGRCNRLSAEDPPAGECSEETDPPVAVPEDTDNQEDVVSPREKRKMKDALDDFLERD